MTGFIKGLFRGIYRVIYSNGKMVTINGMPFRVSPKIARGVKSEVDEPPFNMLKRLCTNADVVFDIGANLGIISLLLSRACKKTTTIHAFEPTPAVFAIMAKNAMLQKSFEAAQIVPHNLALSDTVGTINFATSESHTENHISKDATANTIPVSTTTIDRFCADNKVSPDVMKIDVEGAEYMVLSGAVGFLSQANCVLLVELHRRPLAEAGITNDVFAALLNRINYILYDATGNEIPYNQILTSTSFVILSRNPLSRELFSE